MAKKIKDFPDGKYMKCAACGHVSDSGISMNPTEETPREKIYIQIGSRSASMFCTNPNCNCYTIYAPSSDALERLTERYKSKKPLITASLSGVLLP